jgi:hypothetical protein
MYVLVTTVIQNIIMIQVDVSQPVLLVASMEIAQNQINAPVMLVISRTIRIPMGVYQTVPEGVRMECVLLRTHALAMKVSLLIRTKGVRHPVQEVVSMGTALH